MRRVAAAVAMLIVGCGGSAIPKVVDAWTRPLPPSSGAIALYVGIEGGDGDHIIGLDSPLCDAVELHDTTLEDRIMRMRLVELPYRVDGGLDMNPAGMHIMCIDPTASPQLGDSVEVTITFEDYGELAVDVPVEDR